MHINVQGIKGKIDELNIILNKINNISFLCINEHNLRIQNSFLLNKLENFYVADIYTRQNESSSGGSAILLKSNKNFKFKVREDLKFLNEDYIFECSVIEVSSLSMPALIISLYRVPYSFTLKPFLNKLEAFLAKIDHYKGHIYIASDCNLNVLSTQNRYISAFINILDRHGFDINFREITRSASKTCIDNIITNKLSKITFKAVKELGLSDHRALFISLENHNPIASGKNKKQLKRSFNMKNRRQFLNSISNVHWVFRNHFTVDQNYNLFLEQFLHCFNESFPYKTACKGLEKKLIG